MAHSTPGTASDTLQEVRQIDLPELRLSTLTVATEHCSISRLRDHLVGTLMEYSILDSHCAARAAIALEEALANAVYHGNLELESSLKCDGFEEFYREAELRSGLAPWKHRMLSIVQLAGPLGGWVTIQDEGAGFCQADPSKERHESDAELPSGRGLTMMRAFADEVFFNKSGNQTTLVFYATPNIDVHHRMANFYAERPRISDIPAAAPPASAAVSAGGHIAEAVVD